MFRKIWVVSELYYPEETSTGYFLTKIAEGLAENFPVGVLCGQPSYSERGLKAPLRERYHGVDIRRCPATTANKNVLLFKLMNLVTITLSIFFTALWVFNKKDLVFVVTNPPSLPFVIMLACRLRGAKYNLIVHDVYPEVLVAAGILRPDSLPVRFLDWLNAQLYRGALKVITLGRDMSGVTARKLNRNDATLQIISNWADLDEIIPAPRTENKLLQKLGLAHKFVVQYCGNMGRTHGLEQLAEAIKQLRDYPDIHFLLVGSGAKKGWLENHARQHQLQNVTLLDRRPRPELSDTLNACDVAIITFMPGMTGLSVPSRMYNILASGKPILAITDCNSELALVIQEEAAGWVVPPNDPAKIVTAILEARAHSECLAGMGVRGRVAVEQKYSLPKVIASYTTIINSLNGLS